MPNEFVEFITKLVLSILMENVIPQSHPPPLTALATGILHRVIYQKQVFIKTE